MIRYVTYIVHFLVHTVNEYCMYEIVYFVTSEYLTCMSEFQNRPTKNVYCGF